MESLSVKRNQIAAWKENGGNSQHQAVFLKILTSVLKQENYDLDWLETSCWCACIHSLSIECIE